MSIQLRRGTNAERATITPVEGELIYTTDTKTLFVGDGDTQGGIQVSNVGALTDPTFNSLTFAPGLGSAIIKNETPDSNMEFRIKQGDVTKIAIQIDAETGHVIIPDSLTTTYLESSYIYTNRNTEPDAGIVGNLLSVEGPDDGYTTFRVVSNKGRGSIAVRYVDLDAPANSIPRAENLGGLFFEKQDAGDGPGGFSRRNGIVSRPYDITLQCFDINGELGNNTLRLTSDGYVGIGTGIPTEKLHVVGDFRLVGSMFTSQYIQLGNYSNLGRTAITPVNGMLIYNRTINKFQGYQNGAWINLDTGTAAPFTSYRVEPVGGVTSINEGSALTFNVTGTDITDGTYYWTVTSAGDFIAGNGTVVITSNIGSITVTPRADFTTEGVETFTLSLRTGSGTGTIVAVSPVITINDTSLTRTYAVTTAGGVTSINEGSTLTLNVATTNVANGTTLYWTVSNSGDFATSSGSFIINSNEGSFTVTPTADSTTEGAESFVVSIRTVSISGSIVTASPTITINDTSLTP